ncbi:diaminopimelate decarboxylase [Escherichia coli]|uniref:Diaminopimelate decarboxylase n=1 Tax=Escherichia coli TaxID=562 RepID=A0A485JAI6_ECOLX|nr:diaminopimelate decarboxylase [Escherichia coli]
MPHSLFSTDTDLTAENLLRLPAEFGCPVWVYDAQIIRRQIAALKQFDVVRFAQKACSNIHILRLMREKGVKVDSVSLGEIERALAAGYNPQTHPDDIVFTADVIDQATLERVNELQIPVNAGSVDMLDQLGQVSPGHRVWLRVNPGFGHGHSQKTNTGGENSKHGIWYTDLPAALDVIQRHHLQLVGIHMHIGSGVDYAHLEQYVVLWCVRSSNSVRIYRLFLRAVGFLFLINRVKRRLIPNIIMVCGMPRVSKSPAIWAIL